MKLVLIYRKRRLGANSIEELFHNIAKELSSKIEVIEFELRDKKYIVHDILKIRSLHADIYHVTGDVHYIINLLPKHKTILTVHDINHYIHDLGGLKKIVYRWIWLTLPIRYAAQVTTISFQTKQSIINELKLNRQIQLIPNCYNAEIFQPNNKPFNSKTPVILQVGTNPNKNLPRLIAALEDLDCQLVIIGKLNADYIRLLKQRAINYTNLVNLSLIQVYEQYCKCDIVAFISLNEGFGVPIIEAQAARRVVITSNYEPMSSVAGGGALLVDPLSVDSIRNGLIKLVNDSHTREKLIDNGNKNIIQYSPMSIAEKYYQLYCNML